MVLCNQPKLLLQTSVTTSHVSCWTNVFSPCCSQSCCHNSWTWLLLRAETLVLSYCSRYNWSQELWSHLRSAAHGDFAVPCPRKLRYGQRSFAVSGPTLWNSLPLTVHDPLLSLSQFCVRLKTILISDTNTPDFIGRLPNLRCKYEFPIW